VRVEDGSHNEEREMSEFDEVERDEIAVQFVRAEDGIPGIRQAWDALEAVVDLHSRHFYGAFYPRENEYRACIEVRDGDELVDGLESGTLPGGRYLRARLHGEPPAVYERIGPTFDELAGERAPDESRPGLEYYRRRDEIDLLLPI
jgi:predicted transcriptional regulator YdeE